MGLFTKSYKSEQIIVSLAAAIFMFIAIILFIRYLKRRILRFIYEIDGGILGLHPKFIAELPIITYGKNPKCNVTVCSICLNELEDGDVLRQLPNCMHMLHQECIDKWLATCGACPVCRAIVRPKETDSQVIIEVEETSTSADTSEMMSAVSSLYSSPLNANIGNAVMASSGHPEFNV